MPSSKKRQLRTEDARRGLPRGPKARLEETTDERKLMIRMPGWFHAQICRSAAYDQKSVTAWVIDAIDTYYKYRKND